MVQIVIGMSFLYKDAERPEVGHTRNGSGSDHCPVHGQDTWGSHGGMIGSERQLSNVPSTGGRAAKNTLLEVRLSSHTPHPPPPPPPFSRCFIDLSQRVRYYRPFSRLLLMDLVAIQPLTGMGVV